MLEELNWRYAAKKMTGEKIPKDKLDRILESVRLAPTSFGAQPFKVLHVSDSNTKEKMKPFCLNQNQITECSDLLIFCANSNFNEKSVDEYMKLVSETKNVSLESLSGFSKSVKSTANKTYDEKLFWAKKQCYIALGFGLFASALEQVDACPMEGFDPEKLDKLISIEGLKSTVLLALGFRSDLDKYSKEKKVRKPNETLFQEFKIE